ncbi:hypothetical protein KC343_g15921 [Hortaea werneckii]|uniref:RNase H type-1 domain-containing protein n=1 Tax=Hortaea werneckii TaxID=91943 RepID=A0A3M7BZ83_HORWE|nr:hypothetical protein KC323_g3371 [Hortaea werneckii]KAI6868397.1 hypothetical protein KC338_g3999 [Hortaea werneckii]KAI7354349.1 hypothetical protein KC320_g3495 [Hortaea werneckii]KAI7569855.1 hypothetical protein KC317_g2961 [Hortaea werneckii]KAI7596211.1 hypothetical protein KC346_g15267 [Hortaea werneckii]
MSYHAELYHDVTLEYNRRFYPEEYYGEDWRASPIEHTAYGFRFLTCIGKCEGKCTCFERQDTITQPLVIASDGGLRDWRTWGIEVPVAGMGVFVGPDSPYNVSEILPLDDYSEPNASHVEIEAAICALETAMRIKEDNWLPEVKVIILKSDSLRIVVKPKSTYIDAWKKNGYLTPDGKPVSLYRDLYYRLENAIIALYVQHGVKVLFHWMPREYNGEADALVHLAMDSHMFGTVSAGETTTSVYASEDESEDDGGVAGQDDLHFLAPRNEMRFLLDY